MIDGFPHVVRRFCGLMPFAPVELLPGLVVRQLAGEDLAAYWPMAAAGSVGWITPSTMAEWQAEPDRNWLTVTEWKGRILQFDFFHLEHGVGEVRAGLTLRPARDRSSWFWREVRRPVLERLLALGYRTMHSRIRAHVAAWAETMARLWGATSVQLPNGQTQMRYDLQTCLGLCEGWPLRPTAAAPGVHEVTAEEAAPLLEAAWGRHPGLPGALRLLEAAWHLDRAALLAVGPHVRAVRWRWGTTGALIALTPIQAPQPDVSALVREWLRAAGYTHLRVFVPAAQYSGSAAIRDQLAREGFMAVSDHARTGTTEWESRV